MSLAEIGPGVQPKIFSFSHRLSVCDCVSLCAWTKIPLGVPKALSL